MTSGQAAILRPTGPPPTGRSRYAAGRAFRWFTRYPGITPPLTAAHVPPAGLLIHVDLEACFQPVFKIVLDDE
jgi:hypothetical protein